MIFFFARPVCVDYGNFFTGIIPTLACLGGTLVHSSAGPTRLPKYSSFKHRAKSLDIITARAPQLQDPTD